MPKKNDFKLDVVSVRLVKDAPIYSEHTFNNPADIAAVMGDCMCQFDREVVCVVNLRSDLKPINVHFASVGSLNEAMAHPRELFKSSILSNAASMMLIHCHPSGNVFPSKADTMMTDRMNKLCELMGIPLIDHIIVGGDNREFFSFREKGMFDNPKITLSTDYRTLDIKSPLVAEQGNEKSHSIEGDRVNSAIDGLIEKVGMFAIEKKAISVDQVKENFSINSEQAESVIRQLETIGVLGKKNEDGTHTVMMDKDAFINRVRGYQDLAERMRAVAASKNANLADVTISKKLIIEENDHAVKARVPGTWGEEAKYVWLRKENIMEIHGGKTMLTFLDSTKDYKLYDEQNRVVTTQKGTELYTHYDKVESSVRERYEKVQKQQKKTTQKKTVTTKKAR